MWSIELGVYPSQIIDWTFKKEPQYIFYKIPQGKVLYSFTSQTMQVSL